MLRTKENKTHHGRSDPHEIPSTHATDPFSEDFDPLEGSSSDEAEGSNDDNELPQLTSHNEFLKRTDAQKKVDEYSISWGHSEKFLDGASSKERHRARTGSLFGFTEQKPSSSLSHPKPVTSAPLPETKPWSPFDSDSDSDEDNIKGDTTHAQSAPPTPTPGHSLLSSMFSKSTSSDPALPSSPLSALSTSNDTTLRSPLVSLSTLRDTPSPLSSNSTPTFSGMKPPST